jgi:tetratricopeptide (TPR) repeat protein
MRGHHNWVESVAWSPDGTRLASAGLDNSVRVWDPRTGDEAFVLQGNFGMFHYVSWSPNGAQVAAASSDGQIWLWDATRGFERDTTRRALPYIDRKIASGTARGEDLLWYAQSYFRAGKHKEAIALVKDNPSTLLKLYGKLTADERKVFSQLRPDVAADWVRAQQPDPAQAAFARARSLVQSGVAASESGRLAEAIRDLQAGIDLLRTLLKDNPNDGWLSSNLGISLGFLGGAKRDSHQPAEALAAFREARSVLESMHSPAALDLYNLACDYAQLSVLPQHAATPATAAEREALADQALEALARCIAAGTKNFAYMDKDHDLDSLRERPGFRALLLESTGHTREALPHLVAHSAAHPNDTALFLKVAALEAWFGEEKELAATRERILSIAKGTNDVTTAERAAKACSIRASTDKAELEAAVALARKGVELGKGKEWWEWRLLALGMTEYRSGNYTAAVEALLDAEKAGPNNPILMGIAAFYRAMSLFRQGKPDDARKLAIAAAAQMRPLPKDEQNPWPNNACPWDDLILWLAYKEAKEMIKFDMDSPPKTENN